MSDKPRIATYWLGGCAGCHMSLLDLDERLLDLAKAVTLTASPITDIKEPPEVDVALVEGAVCNSDNLYSTTAFRTTASRPTDDPSSMTDCSTRLPGPIVTSGPMTDSETRAAATTHPWQSKELRTSSPPSPASVPATVIAGGRKTARPRMGQSGS